MWPQLSSRSRDNASANRALDYLFNVQKKADGVSPKTPGLTAGRLAELADGPGCVPACACLSTEAEPAEYLVETYQAAADFIVRYGPATGRIAEEKPGYSPATIAAEIAGLVCAARIAEISGDGRDCGQLSKSCR